LERDRRFAFAPAALRRDNLRVIRSDSGLPTVARSQITDSPPSRFALWRATSACIHERRLVSRIFASWNQIVLWLRQVDELQKAA
jgi:hypothetical protein